MEELNDTSKDIEDDFRERIDFAYKSTTGKLFEVLAHQDGKGKRALKKVSEKLLLIKVKYTYTLARFNENAKSWYIFEDYFPDERRNALAIALFNRIDAVILFALDFKSS
nr:hypothetical protein [Pedobacter sp. ASV19]